MIVTIAAVTGGVYACEAPAGQAGIVARGRYDPRGRVGSPSARALPFAVQAPGW
jgi:hypothetical protein